MSNRHVVQAGKVQSSTVPNKKIRKYYFCFLTVDNFSKNCSMKNQCVLLQNNFTNML